MKPILIVTRPAPDGARFAGLVQDAIDVDVLLAPLQEIVPIEASCEADAFIFTSSNGVAQAARLGLKGGHAWCVGDRTAELARSVGFDAISAQGTVEEVLAMILADAPQGKIAHIRGKEARGDLGPRLRAAGINCVDVIAYEQREVALTPEAKAAIAGTTPVVLPLFSPRSAALLVGQVIIGPNVVILAMSDAVAKIIPDQIAEVVPSPEGAAMLVATIKALQIR